jgi:transcriptional regulator with XRE-family HTH domain
MEFMIRRIKERMDLLEIKQEHFAKKAGVSQSTVNRVLNTPTKSRIDTLRKIANALLVPLEYLTISDERKARLCLSFQDMSDEDLQATIFHIEKEKLWKEKGPKSDTPGPVERTG